MALLILIMKASQLLSFFRCGIVPFGYERIPLLVIPPCHCYLSWHRITKSYHILSFAYRCGIVTIVYVVVPLIVLFQFWLILFCMCYFKFQSHDHGRLQVSRRCRDKCYRRKFGVPELIWCSRDLYYIFESCQVDEHVPTDTHV